MDQRREFFLTRMRLFSLLTGIMLFFRCADKGAQDAPLGYPSLTLCKLAVACKLEKLVDTQPSVPDSLECFSDLVYKTVGSRALRLDVYRLKGSRSPSPVLVFIHGGAWKSGDKRDYSVYLLPFAAKGYITVSVAYRLSREAQFPAAVIRFLGKTWVQAPDLYAQASPLFWIDGQDPATLLFHGTLDELVPVAQSDSLAARLQQMHVPVVYHRLRGWPHTMDLSQRVNDYCVYHMSEFFKKYL